MNSPQPIRTVLFTLVVCSLGSLSLAPPVSAQTTGKSDWTQDNPDLEILYSVLFTGGENTETDVVAVAVKPNGNLLVAGTTRVPDLNNAPPPVRPYNRGVDMWVAEVDTSQGEFVWITYIGGSSLDVATALTVDADGNAYLVGYTEAAQDGTNDFPVVNAIQPDYGGGIRDAALSKFDDSGNLLWATFLGGSGDDRPQQLEVGPNGEVVLAGFTGSSDFPLVNSLQPSLAGDNDVFVLTISPAGSLVFSTVLGGLERDRAWGFRLDSEGVAWLTGETFSTDFPTVDALDDTLNGPQDAFITAIGGVLDGTSAEILYSTYFGGDAREVGLDLSFDASGAVFSIGRTNSDNMPVVGAVQPTNAGGTDAYLTAISPTDGLLLSTYAGGVESDRLDGVRPLGPGCVFTVGSFGDASTSRSYCLDGTAGDTASIGGFRPDAMEVWGQTGDAVQYLVAGFFLVESGASQTTRPFEDGSHSPFHNSNTVGRKTQTRTLEGTIVGLSHKVPVRATTDLAVEKTVAPDSAWPGESITYSIKLINNGPEDVEDVGVVDVIPLGVEILPESVPDGCQFGGNIVTCSADLKVGEERTFVIPAKVRLSEQGQITNVAFLGGSGISDTDPTNDRDSSTVQVRPMQVKIVDKNTVFHRLLWTGETPNGLTNPWERRNLLDDVDEFADDIFTSDHQADGSTMMFLENPSLQVWLDSLTVIKRRAQPGQEVTLAYFGHGWNGVYENGAIKDRDPDEAIGGDETLWMKTDIRDDDMAEYLKGFKPGVTILLYLGACYGGGFTDGANDVKEGPSIQVVGVAGSCPQDGSYFDLAPILATGLSGVFVETLTEEVADGAGDEEADADGDGIITAQELKDFLISEGWDIGPPTGQKTASEPVIRSSQSLCGAAEFGRCPALADTRVQFEPEATDHPARIKIEGEYFGAGSTVSVLLMGISSTDADTATVATSIVDSQGNFDVEFEVPELVEDQYSLYIESRDSEGFFDWWHGYVGSIEVDVDGDGEDTAPGDLVCESVDGGCSLRAAIQEANAVALPADVSIRPGLTIVPTDTLPVFKDGVILKGNGATLSGTSLAQGASGLTIASNGSDVSDLEISGFPGSGIAVIDGSGNTFRKNRIMDNGGLGIDLLGDGPTPNDATDSDEGPNRLQNSPEISLTEISQGRVTVTLKVDTDTANARYPLTIDFYRADVEGGEGAVWLASSEITSAEAMSEVKSVFFPNPNLGVAPGDRIVATATDADGNTSEFSGDSETVVSVEGAETIPEVLTLEPNYPDPFRDETALRFALPSPGLVSIEVFDVLGNRVARILEEERAAGWHSLRWSASSSGLAFASGTYFVRVRHSGVTRVETLVVKR
jgi:uncharacterized repeat protein (TIGR01451 family)